MSIWTDTARPSRTGTMDKQQFITSLEQAWKTGSRWRAVTRPYTAGDVYRLRGSIDIEYSLARYGAARLWQLFQDDDYVAVLSAVTGNQAIQQVQAGLKAIYVSGWQVAADANNALEMYPDQSLYPSDSVPALLRRINNALKRADEIAHLKDDLVGPFESVVDAAEQGGHGVGGVEALIGVHLEGIVRVGRHLPPAHVDRVEARLHLLDGLVPRDGRQHGEVVVLLQQLPQPGGPVARERVLDVDRAAQAVHVAGTVRSPDPVPTVVRRPVPLERRDERLPVHGCPLPLALVEMLVRDRREELRKLRAGREFGENPPCERKLRHPNTIRTYPFG